MNEDGSKGYIRPFQEQGHYTQVHDAVFDEVMPTCPPNAWKVLCLIIRKTRGWNKDSDRIPYEQLLVGTGIGSRSTLSGALKWLEDEGLVTREGGKDAKGRHATITYSLNRGYELGYPSTETVPGSGTETVRGPSTETVLFNKQGNKQEETEPPSQNGKNENVLNSRTDTPEESLDTRTPAKVTHLNTTTQQTVETLMSIENWDLGEAKTIERVNNAYQEYPHINIGEVAKTLAFKIKQRVVSYKKPSKAFTNWVVNQHSQNGQAYEPVIRSRKKKV